MNNSQKVKILILGGESSLAQKLIPLINTNVYEVNATFKGLSKKTKSTLNANWLSLDLNNEKSLEKFLAISSKLDFDILISLIGKTSSLNYMSDENLVFEYLKTYVYNQSHVIFDLVEQMKKNKTKNRIIINISSRSIEYGSFDILYAQSKSSIDVLVKSLNKSAGEQIKFFNVIPGLIKGSRMYNEMPLDVRASHEVRSNGTLLTSDQFAKFLVNLVEGKFIPDLPIRQDGINVYVGPEYR